MQDLRKNYLHYGDNIVSVSNPPVKSLTAYNRIRKMILNGELLPGSRLVLSELEEKLKIGRGPIREALMRLDKSGLVQNLPYKGAIVILPPSSKEMEYIYLARAQVENALAHEAMNRAKLKDITHIEKIQNKLELNEDESIFFDYDREFHNAIYSIAQMPHFLKIANMQLDLVAIFLKTRHYRIKDIALICEQHRKIILAFHEKNADLLTENLHDNIIIGLDFVRSEMKNWN